MQNPHPYMAKNKAMPQSMSMKNLRSLDSSGKKGQIINIPTDGLPHHHLQPHEDDLERVI